MLGSVDNAEARRRQQQEYHDLLDADVRLRDAARGREGHTGRLPKPRAPEMPLYPGSQRMRLAPMPGRSLASRESPEAITVLSKELVPVNTPRIVEEMTAPGVDNIVRQLRFEQQARQELEERLAHLGEEIKRNWEVSSRAMGAVSGAQQRESQAHRELQDRLLGIEAEVSAFRSFQNEVAKRENSGFNLHEMTRELRSMQRQFAEVKAALVRESERSVRLAEEVASLSRQNAERDQHSATIDGKITVMVEEIAQSHRTAEGVRDQTDVLIAQLRSEVAASGTDLRERTMREVESLRSQVRTEESRTRSEVSETIGQERKKLEQLETSVQHQLSAVRDKVSTIQNEVTREQEARVRGAAAIQETFEERWKELLHVHDADLQALDRRLVAAKDESSQLSASLDSRLQQSQRALVEMTRSWSDTAREALTSLHADIDSVREELHLKNREHEEVLVSEIASRKRETGALHDALNERRNELLSFMKAELEELQQKNAPLRKKLDTLAGELGALQADTISKIEQELSSVKTTISVRVDDLESRVGDNARQIVQTEEVLKEEQEKASSLEAATANLNHKIEGVQSNTTAKIQSERNATNKALNPLRQSITAIQRRIDADAQGAAEVVERIRADREELQTALLAKIAAAAGESGRADSAIRDALLARSEELKDAVARVEATCHERIVNERVHGERRVDELKKETAAAEWRRGVETTRMEQSLAHVRSEIEQKLQTVATQVVDGQRRLEATKQELSSAVGREHTRTQLLQQDVVGLRTELSRLRNVQHGAQESPKPFDHAGSSSSPVDDAAGVNWNGAHKILPEDNEPTSSASSIRGLDYATGTGTEAKPEDDAIGRDANIPGWMPRWQEGNGNESMAETGVNADAVSGTEEKLENRNASDSATVEERSPANPSGSKTSDPVEQESNTKERDREEEKAGSSESLPGGNDESGNVTPEADVGANAEDDTLSEEGPGAEQFAGVQDESAIKSEIEHGDEVHDHNVPGDESAGDNELSLEQQSVDGAVPSGQSSSDKSAADVSISAENNPRGGEPEATPEG